MESILLQDAMRLQTIRTMFIAVEKLNFDNVS